MNYKNIFLLISLAINAPTLIICSSNENEQTDCTICWDREPNVVLGCSHSFCQTCIDTHRRNASNCPTCRTPIDSTKMQSKNQCSICKLNGANADSFCGHRFHENCLQQHIEQQMNRNQKANCPVCQRSVFDLHPTVKAPVTPTVAPITAKITPQVINQKPAASVTVNPVKPVIAPKTESFFSNLFSRKNLKYWFGSILSVFVIYNIVKYNQEQTQDK